MKAEARTWGDVDMTGIKKEIIILSVIFFHFCLKKLMKKVKDNLFQEYYFFTPQIIWLDVGVLQDISCCEFKWELITKNKSFLWYLVNL